MFAIRCGSSQLQQTHLFASQSAVPKYDTKIHVVISSFGDFSHNPMHQWQLHEPRPRWQDENKFTFILQHLDVQDVIQCHAECIHYVFVQVRIPCKAFAIVSGISLTLMHMAFWLKY